MSETRQKCLFSSTNIFYLIWNKAVSSPLYYTDEFTSPAKKPHTWQKQLVCKYIDLLDFSLNLAEQYLA